MADTSAPTQSMKNYFLGSYIVAAIALLLGAVYGLAVGGFANAVAYALRTGILIVVEVTLSFDNAVVNAGILVNWPAVWRRYFLVFGILVAVVGMRFLLPLLVVALTSWTNIGAITQMAFQNPDAYATLLVAAHYLIASVSGAFLLRIACEFYFDKEKTEHWFGALESRLASFGEVESIGSIITIALVLVIAFFLTPKVETLGFLAGGVIGSLCYDLVKWFGTAVGGEAAQEGKAIVKATAGGFAYLEVLDASFSFDGVMGAFAVTTSLPIIMLGLGAGAYFVRSLTIYAVDQNTLAEYRYLSHGAYWAIALLALAILLSVAFPIPDYIIGLIGVVLIGAALAHSVIANRRDATLLKGTTA